MNSLCECWGLLGWQAFAWLHHAHLKERSHCLSLCWESGLKLSPLFPAHGSSCSDLWLQTCPGPHPLLRPGADRHVVHHPPKTVLLCPNRTLTRCPPTSLLLWWQSPLCLISVSKSSMSWNWVTKVTSVKLGTYIANPRPASSWNWSCDVCLFLPELSNKVSREDWRMDSARSCPKGDLAQDVIWGVEKPSLRLITWQPLFKRMDVWFNTWLIIKSWRSRLTALPLKRNCSSKTPEERRVWLSDYTFHCKAVM